VAGSRRVVLLPVTVAGPRRTHTGFPQAPLRTTTALSETSLADQVGDPEGRGHLIEPIDFAAIRPAEGPVDAFTRE